MVMPSWACAKQALVRMKFGSAAPCHASSFIKELAPDHIEVVDFQKIVNAPVSEAGAANHFRRMREMIGKSGT